MTTTKKMVDKGGHLQNTHIAHQKSSEPLQEAGCHEIQNCTWCNDQLYKKPPWIYHTWKSNRNSTRVQHLDLTSVWNTTVACYHFSFIHRSLNVKVDTVCPSSKAQIQWSYLSPCPACKLTTGRWPCDDKVSLDTGIASCSCWTHGVGVLQTSGKKWLVENRNTEEL